MTNCAICHGEAEKGDGPGRAGLSPPPADLADAFHARYSDAGRLEVIRRGLPATATTGFDGRLSSLDVLDVYAHVRALRGN